MSVGPFLTPIPKKLLEDQETAEFFRSLAVFLDDLTREDGDIDTISTTEDIVLTHSEKVDLITVSAAVNLDSEKAATTANTASLATIQNSLPAYTVTNSLADRIFDANAAAGVISNPPTQAEVTLLQTALLELSDVVATVILDMQTKNVLG